MLVDSDVHRPVAPDQIWRKYRSVSLVLNDALHYLRLRLEKDIHDLSPIKPR